MKRVLGIDLGTNSLGWGIVENSKILDCGVLIFDQGIPLVKGRESDKSPAAERTQFRAARRLKYRRRLRKYHTLKVLLENGMCPLSLQELQDWIRRGVFPIGNPEFVSWLNSTVESNPYYFRAKAVAGKVKPYELGRAFYHIAIRRGFKSSKKDQSQTNDKETSELKNKIKQLEEKLILSGQTLGEYLYECVKQNIKIRGEIKCGRVEHYIPEFEKICRVQEISGELKRKLFDALFLQRPLRSKRFLVGKCSLEKKFPRTLAAHPLFEKYRMLSFINSIKVQVENNESRFLTRDERLTAISAFMVKASCIKFEKIGKALKKAHFKNLNISFNYREDQTVTSASLIYQLQNILGCNDIFSWNQEYCDNRGQLKTMNYQTLFDGLKFFKIDFDGNDSSFKRFAVERIGLSEEKAAQFMDLTINDSYAKYSLFAIRKIIPFLEMGFVEPYAVYLAKLPDVLGVEFFSLHKDSILADFQQCVDDYTWEKNNITFRDKCRVLSLSERFKQLLEEKYKCSAAKIGLLYEFKEKSNYSDHISDGVLPRVELGMMFNPMVHRSLTVLRRLVNYLRKNGKIDADTEIHIELAREVNDKNTRLAIVEMQRKNEALRSRAVAEFAEYNIVPTEDQILRWRLWNEQKKICIYTGRKILESEIFTNNFSSLDIEHTVPRSLGGENNLENLTLCDSTYNRDVKKGKLPSECPNYDNSADGGFTVCDGLTVSGFYEQLEAAERDYSAISAKLKSVPSSSPARPALRQKHIVAFHNRKYWREKLLAFEMGRDELESGFTRRQLAATGVMSRHALQFLKSAYSNVYANNGRVTAFTRKTWGLQDQYSKKERVDHTHHAIDALVIAALDREGLSRIANAYHECEFAGNERSVIKISYPWSTFPEDVYSAVENIIVKKLVSRNETKQAKHNNVYLTTPLVSADGSIVKRVLGQGDTVRGQLHDQTFYGCILDNEQKERFVLRTTLTPDKFSSLESLEKIVDKGVREAVITQIRSRMYEGATFADALSAGVFMKTTSGEFDGPVIKKVRVFRDDVRSPLMIKKQTYATSREHKNNYYAETSKGGNFMIALYRSPDVPANERRYVYELISLWSWAEEHRQADYVPLQKRTDKGEFIGTISPGATVLFYKDSPDELKSMSRKQLCHRAYIITELSKDGRMCLRWNREARSKKDAMQFMSQQFGAQQSSEIEWDKSIPLLRISSGAYQNHTLFCGIDFDISVDGEITFRE